MMGRGPYVTLSTHHIFYCRDVPYNPRFSSRALPQILRSHVMNYIVDDNVNLCSAVLKYLQSLKLGEEE